MNPELLRLIEAFDALRHPTHPEEHTRRLASYQSLLSEALEKRPNLSRESLEGVVRLAHRQWLDAQDKLLRRRLTT
ncbi:MAG: hypothetical protein C5B50_18495 [Verrucomicrobia bacterium]|nr:MAG: hypothetical protein C5B50_18495 [Verrucomicrobiota bacterium]